MEIINNINELEDKFEDEEIILIINGQEKKIEEPAVIYHEKEGRFAIGEVKDMVIRFRALKTKFEVNGLQGLIDAYSILAIPKDREFIKKVLEDKLYISEFMAKVKSK